MTALRLLKQWQILRIRAKPLDAVPVLAAAAGEAAPALAPSTPSSDRL